MGATALSCTAMRSHRVRGGDYVVSRSEQASRPLTVYGPTPLVARSPLLLRLRPLEPADRRAVAAGVSRRARGLGEQLDEVAYAETELDEHALALLVPEPARPVIASAISDHGAVLQVRRDFTHFEVSPRRKDSVSESEMPAVIEAVATVAEAARALPPDAARELRETGSFFGGALAFTAVLGAIIGVPGLTAARLSGFGSAIVVGLSAALAVVAFALARAMLRRLGASTTTRHRRVLPIALPVAFAVGVGLLLAIPLANRWLDSSEGSERFETIADLRRSKSGAIGMVCVERDGGRDCLVVLPPGDDAFQPSDRGGRVAILERPGALGLPWVARLRRVE